MTSSKRQSVVLLLLWLAIMCLSAYSDTIKRPRAIQDDPPKAEMFPDGRDHDFGIVPYGALCKHEFRMINTTDQPLEILNLRVS